jgi:hypothetical protein
MRVPMRLPSVAYVYPLRCQNEGQRGPLHVNWISPLVFNEFHTSKYLVTSQTMLDGNRNFEEVIEKWSGRRTRTRDVQLGKSVRN